MSLTERAYQYAVKKKKVNQGVIEAFKDGYDAGITDVKKRLPAKELLEIVAARFPTKKDVEYALGMYDARRGINEDEGKQIAIRVLLENTIKEYQEIIER